MIYPGCPALQLVGSVSCHMYHDIIIKGVKKFNICLQFMVSHHGSVRCIDMGYVVCSMWGYAGIECNI